jgi:hypothetical protein
MGLASMALLLVMFLIRFATHSFASMANYASLDKDSRNALDRMSTEIRQADRVLASGSNYLTFSVTNGTIRYYYDPVGQTLTRSVNGVADSRPLLQQCQFLQFGTYQRNPIGGTYDQYPTADSNTCKLVQLSWICARSIIGTTQNTESVESAKVVIRKE